MNLLHYILVFLLTRAFILLLAVCFSSGSQNITRNLRHLFYQRSVHLLLKPRWGWSQKKKFLNLDKSKSLSLKFLRFKKSLSLGKVYPEILKRNFILQNPTFKMLEVIQFVVIFTLSLGLQVTLCYFCVKFRNHLPKPLQHLCCWFQICAHFHPWFCKTLCGCNRINQDDSV